MKFIPDFPFTAWLSHFSDIVCASHKTNYSYRGENHITTGFLVQNFPIVSPVVSASHKTKYSQWDENPIATKGFKLLTEFGSPSGLETELRTKGYKLHTLIKAAGLQMMLISILLKHPVWVVNIARFFWFPCLIPIGWWYLCTVDGSWKTVFRLLIYIPRIRVLIVTLHICTPTWKLSQENICII